MKPEDKELLLKDLCARLPYGAKVKSYSEKTVTLTLGNCDLISMFYKDEDNWYCKPYLRPMSSMTEEEIRKYKCLNDALDENYEVHIDNAYPAFDWLNAHHFDYRGLIDKGLAIEVTDDNNPYKE